MKIKSRKKSCVLIIFALFVGAVLGLTVRQAHAVGSETMYDYAKLPAFLETGLNPNLLLLIDNSGSMYDTAYVDLDDGSKYCVADADEAETTDVNGNGTLDTNFDPNVAYAGYFDSTPDTWYKYNLTDERFEPIAMTGACTSSSAYAHSDLCLILDATETAVTWVRATGRFWNWLTASKFDIEKEILTGGKYDAGKCSDASYTTKVSCEAASHTWTTHDELVLETRGCQEKRFVKTVPVTKGGSNYRATFGVRPPTDIEAEGDPDVAGDTGDVGYNGSLNNTRIEIFKVTTDGFVSEACEDAIDEFMKPDGGNLGQRSTLTLACLGTEGAPESRSAFNGIMQECWYYAKHGDWQGGAGSVTAMRNQCEAVYGTFTGISPYAVPVPGDYVTSENLDQAEICYGQYLGDIDARYGYVGRCWESFYSSGGETCTDRACDPSSDPIFTIVDNECSSSPCCYDNGDGTGVWKVCSGNYNSVQDNCNKPWLAVQDCVVDAGGVLESVGWTDDRYYTDYPTNSTLSAVADTVGENCVGQAMRDYCLSVDQATIVDPTDNFAGTETTPLVPAVLIEYATTGQLGDPLLVMKGRVNPLIQPLGLVHEFKYNLRLGAMVFNDGTKEECDVTTDGTGRHVATLYDCLVEKGIQIHASSVPLADRKDGGRIISYISEGSDHTLDLARAINAVDATTWTPTAEAMYNAVGYYTQDASSNSGIGLRLNPPTGDSSVLKEGDFIRDSDVGTALGPNYHSVEWDVGTQYYAGDIVWTDNHSLNYGTDSVPDYPNKLYRAKNDGISAFPVGCSGCSKIEEDEKVKWMSYDPVQAGCQSNSVLLITDGASTADVNGKASDTVGMVDFVTTAGKNDSDAASTWHTTKVETGEYECKDWVDAKTTGTIGVYDVGEDVISTNYGSTLLDDLTWYGHSSSAIYNSYNKINEVPKKPIDTYILVTGSLQDDGTTNECNPKTIMTEAAANGGTSLIEASDPSQLEEKLRNVFSAIGGEVSSGSAASVISHSRSGDGAIYQAIFYPKQVDLLGNEVEWSGDVHSLWLDAKGQIREDCGGTITATDTICPELADKVMDFKNDFIIEFYTDATGSAMARRFWDANGDGNYNKDATCSISTHTNEPDCLENFGTWTFATTSDWVVDNIALNKLSYIWSGANWLAEALDSQRSSYGAVENARYIFTMIPDGSGNATAPIPFVPSTDSTPSLSNALGGDYAGYFNAGTDAKGITRTADGIVNYIRGLDQVGYRSRKIDWTSDSGTEIAKLGDIIHSTPTLVGPPAENYDVVYGDPTYRVFRKQYQKRRSVVYAGGNDGGLHAFNGGYYDRHAKEFLEAPPDTTTKTHAQYELGSELWMYVPSNVFPHLRWLTNENYGEAHNYYVDGKPYIFDAKIFDDNDIHPGGWGTILVAGMRYGGGNIQVASGDIMRSSYVILDITDPEYPPVVLAELNDAELGYTTGSATAIPMLRCDKDSLIGQGLCDDADWPMDWYLAVGSGPHDSSAVPAGPVAGMQGLSDQVGKVYLLKLGGFGTKVTGTPASLTSIGSGQNLDSAAPPNSIDPTFTTPPALVTGYPRDLGKCSDPTQGLSSTCTGTWNSMPNSFLGDFIAVDYDLSFKTDTLYFGSVYDAVTGGHASHKGAMHRLDTNLQNPDPTTWEVGVFYDVKSPVTAAPSVATDGGRAWVFFGTGRLFSGTEDKAIVTTTYPTQFLGLKERYTSGGVMDLKKPNGGLVADVTTVGVLDDGFGTLTSTPVKAEDLYSAANPDVADADTSSNVDTFALLKKAMNPIDGDVDVYHGWKIKLADGERVIGQPAILGDIVTFTSYIPSNDPCVPDGNSFLWAPYFRTGTAFYRSVLGTDGVGSGSEVLRKVSLGKGLSTTPNIHTGAGDGTKAFVQSSTGAILSIEQTNPGVVKSGMRSWRELSN